MHKKVLLILSFLLLFVTPSFVHAQPNNKFGIHLAVPAEADIQNAAELVNSNGGDWGYITLVIQEDDRSHEKWQSIFDKLRELHLIPIIRLATKPDGGNWQRPNKEDAEQWVEFLDGLNWVVKNRYVILFNETNHGSEWGGSVDPAGYAQIAEIFADKLKARSPDYVVMLAGMDASAPASSPNYADEGDYLKTVVNTIGADKFNQLFGGLSSHSYPNPGFVGSPYAGGRGTVRTYDWELDLLKSIGVKSLPVFVTETGWDGSKMPRSTVADDYQAAFNQVWLPDDRVMAVTPFVLDYQGDPFLGFSWKRFGEDDYYDQFQTVEDMSKTAGEPDIVEKGSIDYDLPKSLVVNSSYRMKISLTNNGEGIWDDSQGYKLVIENLDNNYLFSDFVNIKPHQHSDVDFFFKSGAKPMKKQVKIALYRNDKKVLEGPTWSFEVLPLPGLEFHVSLYPRLKNKGDDFEIQVFDSKEQLVYKRSNVSVEHGKGVLDQVRNITFDRKYRIVVLKPYYLPRQQFITFEKKNNVIVFKRMYPLDFNKDGKFDITDIWALITHPMLIQLLFP